MTIRVTIPHLGLVETVWRVSHPTSGTGWGRDLWKVPFLSQVCLGVVYQGWVDRNPVKEATSRHFESYWATQKIAKSVFHSRAYSVFHHIVHYSYVIFWRVNSESILPHVTKSRLVSFMWARSQMGVKTLPSLKNQTERIAIYKRPVSDLLYSRDSYIYIYRSVWIQFVIISAWPLKFGRLS